MLRYLCCDEHRRDAVSEHPTLNGIDYLEVSDDPRAPVGKRQSTLFVHFIKLLGSRPNKENIRIDGGERIRDVSIKEVSDKPNESNVLVVQVDKPGDFSSYTLRLVKNANDNNPPDGFDPILSSIDFSFKVNCPGDFDCQTKRICIPEQQFQPEISYLAKDYASFRQLMLDRMALLIPDWKERNIADAGITLVELLAHVGDYLSYQQDAVATEAYLGTARSRISVRRHARLADYFMHDGCNARAWVQVKVNTALILPKSTRLLTRVDRQLTCIPPDSQDQALALLPEVFETMHDAGLFPEHNKINFYTWGALQCCLPKDSTRATLQGNFANLKAGDVLIFVETTVKKDVPEYMDPVHQHAVRLINVITKDSEKKDLNDPLYGKDIKDITEIEWHADDALPFPFCISAKIDEESNIEDVSYALGNIVLADHGLTLEEPEDLGEVPEPKLFWVQPTSDRCQERKNNPVPPRYNPHLTEKNLTFAVPYNENSAKESMRYNAKDALPAIILQSKSIQDSEPSYWMPKHDLLNSEQDKTDFVMEVENDGTAYLRFGDDEHGLRPSSGTTFNATYRIGNGAPGNVGANTIVHVVSNEASIIGVNNPLPAQGGVEPESTEHVRQSAPHAFRTQERAVTPEDYVEMAKRHPQVQRAAAAFRWTGSWRTVFMTIYRPGGLPVDDDFKMEIKKHFEKYRMAGHDLEIQGPRFVSLEIEMLVRVKPEYFRDDIKKALIQVFSSRLLPDGRRGVFHPDNFNFGQTVYLSPLYEAAQAVNGLASVQITRFQRLGIQSNEALETGKLILGRLEIARLDNDPNFPENGAFRLIMEGGK